MATTPEERLIKKQRDALKGLCNSVASGFAFKRIKTWNDVYAITGTPSETKQGEVTFKELDAYLKGLREDFEKRIASRQTTAQAAKEQSQESSTVSAGVSVQSKLQQLVETPAIIDKPEEQDFSNANDYGLPENKNHKAFLFWFQKKAVKEILDGFLGFDVGQCKDTAELKAMYLQRKDSVNAKRGLQLLAGTGTGKTFITAAVARYLYDIGFHDDKTFGHTYYLYVTKATVVEQAKRVFENTFNLTMRQGIEIINIEQLRCRAGEVWIKEELTIQNGKEVRQWKWKAAIAPCVIFWDESQGLKNDGSLQNEIACAYNNIKNNTFQLFISATPFTRVCEARCFAVATRKPISDQLGLGHTTCITNETWPTYSSSIAHPSSPDEHNEAAVERLVKDLDKFIVRVKGVRPQFDAQNRIQMITFQTLEERDYYNKAWERYLEEKRKLEAAGVSSPGATGDSKFQLLVQFLKFRMAAEFCRRHTLAKLLFDSVQSGKAAVCALNFKNTIIAVTRILVEEYGVTRDQISLVWGGGQTDLTKKQKIKKALKEKAAQLEAAGLDMTELLADMDLDKVEDREMEELPEHLRLGTQSKDERQSEIDRFQSGKSQYCMYTFRAGGVGLSLHQTDELCKVKVRKQKNGYAVIDDIPKIPVRPRINFVAPTYSAMELVQGLGRCPRLTSLSDTEQVLLFYRGTIEEDVARVVSQKLRCLSKVVRQRETWQDMVVGKSTADDHIEKDVKDEVNTDYDALNNDEEDEE